MDAKTLSEMDQKFITKNYPQMDEILAILKGMPYGKAITILEKAMRKLSLISTVGEVPSYEEVK